MGKRMEGVDLLNRSVVTRGIELGRVVDVILDEAGERPIGLDVRCRDGEHRFLALATARIGEEHIEVDSPLLLLENEQLDFYRSRGRALRSTH
jgi:sporulation protein YlmC with PRC-barrel domain